MHYTLQYIFSNLWRNRGRYILFGLLFFILGGVWLLSLTLGQAAQTIRADMLDSYATLVTIEDITASIFGIDAVHYNSFNDPEIVESMEYISCGMGTELRVNKAPELTGASIIGYDFSLGLDPFTRALDPVPIVRGRMIEADNEILIFEDIYQKIMTADNSKFIEMGASVFTGLGDTIRFRITTDAKQTAEYYLTVVGTVDRDLLGPRFAKFYQTLLEPDGTEKIAHNDRPYIITTMACAEQMLETRICDKEGEDRVNPDKISRYDIVYRLRSADHFDAFVEKINAFNDNQMRGILYEDYKVWRTRMTNAGYTGGTAWEDYANMAIMDKIMQQNAPMFRADLFVQGVEELVAPFEQLDRNTEVMVLFMIALALGVIMILTILNLHARTYEIGVLRCIGMSRTQITLELLAETLLFVLLSLGSGILVGAFAAKFVMPQLFDENHFAVLEEINVLTPALQIMGIGVGIALLAVGCAAVYIQRFRPLAILRNRS